MPRAAQMRVPLPLLCEPIKELPISQLTFGFGKASFLREASRRALAGGRPTMITVENDNNFSAFFPTLDRTSFYLLRCASSFIHHFPPDEI
jgi:hypothetical protein